jgi:pimeloyl-ACP methyl ester carboxylesterase
VELLDPTPCPVTVAWSEHDRILPMHEGLPHARRLVPSARFVILPGLGHVPMIDDPQMVAEVVLRTTGARD